MGRTSGEVVAFSAPSAMARAGRQFSDRRGVSELYLLSPWLLWGGLLLLGYIITLVQMQHSSSPLLRLELSERYVKVAVSAA